MSVSDGSAIFGVVANVVAPIISYIALLYILKSKVETLIQNYVEMVKRMEELEDRFVSLRQYETTTHHLEATLERIERNVMRLTDHILQQNGK